MHAKSFTGAKVSFRTFSQLVDGFRRLALLEHIDGHKVTDDDKGKYAARFRATPALLAFSKERSVNPARVHDHFEFEYDLPKVVLELRAAKEVSYWATSRPPGKSMPFERDGITNALEDNVRELNEFFAQHRLRGGEHHVNEINGRDELVFRVKRVRAFGSYASDAPEVGDVDLAVDLEPRHPDRDIIEQLLARADASGKRLNTYMAQLNYGTLEVEQLLKGRSPYLSIQSGDCPEKFGLPAIDLFSSG